MDFDYILHAGRHRSYVAGDYMTGMLRCPRSRVLEEDNTQQSVDSDAAEVEIMRTMHVTFPKAHEVFHPVEPLGAADCIQRVDRGE